MDYQSFLNNKQILHSSTGFDIHQDGLNKNLFDWQKMILQWAIKTGRSAIFADCGLGKTIIQLDWAQKIVQKTGKKVLILTPLAVAQQTELEGEKFGIECKRSIDGTAKSNITITNYEKLHYFNNSDFIGLVGDESSILKNFDGKRKKQVTEFIRKMPYRLLCTATAAPNDYIELGTSSEALGVMGYMDMLGRFFKNQLNNCSTKRAWANTGAGVPKWRFKKHAEESFWRWVCSWSMAIRKPSDIGFSDDGFSLPKLIEKETVLPVSRPQPGMMFPEPANGLQEQREERRATINERCEMVVQKTNHNDPTVVWCHLNDEGDLLEKIIPGAKQIKGGMTDEKKEQILYDFSTGNLRVLITKPKIGAFGLNWQHCNHMTFFPSHSYEQYYQGVRRCWRFGQKRDVTVDIITTEGEVKVLKNLKKKAVAADKMFDSLITQMNNATKIVNKNKFTNKMEVPSWL